MKRRYRPPAIRMEVKHGPACSHIKKMRKSAGRPRASLRSLLCTTASENTRRRRLGQNSYTPASCRAIGFTPLKKAGGRGEADSARCCGAVSEYIIL